MSREGQLTTIDERPALVFERRLPHSPDRVWRAVSDPGELAQWFVAPIEVARMEEGATFEAMEQRGTVTAVQPGSLLAWEWGGERFRFEVRPDGEGSVLSFTHVFGERENAPHHAVGWDLHFDRLDALLAGTPVPGIEELMEHGFEQEHEYYAEAFGVDIEASRRRMREMMEQA